MSQHPLPLWLLKTPMVIVLSVVVSFFVYWFVSASVEQWKRTSHAGAVALMIFEMEDSKSYAGFECFQGSEGLIELRKENEVLAFGQRVKDLKMNPSKESHTKREKIREMGLSELSIPTENCRRWDDVLEVYQELQEI